MTFLDTNVILRYLLDDHAVQSPQARARLRGTELFTVTPHVLVEAAVVLEKVYTVERAQIVAALQAFVAQDNIEVQGLDTPRVTAALDLCQPSRRVGFADALLWSLAGQEPGATVLTFDARIPTVHPNPRWARFGPVPVEEP